MNAGKHISANLIAKDRSVDQPFPCYGGNGIRGYVSVFNQEGRRLLIGRQGELCGNVKDVDGRFHATEHAIVLTPKTDVDLSWAYQKLTAMNLRSFASKSAQPGLAVGKVRQLRITVPGLHEQERIGSVLSCFQSFVEDLTSGLPAEIAARRKQYEYYRDKLLTFDEIAA